jgi:nucleotide-binding universal stress UspA family protein
MKCILVPTDFSDCAKSAVSAAIALASKLRAEIHFLHITEGPSPAHIPKANDIPLKNSQEVYARNELSLLVALAAKAGVTAAPVLVFDKGNDKIENYIGPLGIDLIVMGSHGAKGIRELVIGSNAQRLIRHSPVPVLVVKKLINDSFKMESIVFASTFKEDVTQPLAQVVNLARLFRARVQILFVNFIDKVSDQETIDTVVKNFSRLYPDVDFTRSTAESNDEEWGIHGFIEMIDADVVALTTADKTGFFSRHSVAEDLVNHERIPVLVLGSPNT